ncbi:hypothetical protein BDF20DRAFT_803599, partial [Mycotypha africana]|uniref:uncharacterized protein n=1 Tax=Mycotypha africana TaxID=64632 RepID=UPI0023006E20
MAWNCGCALKVPDLTPYLWPVVQAECIGKAQDCLSICNKKPAASAGPCSHACQTYYQCNTEMAPPSYLRTDSPDETP